VHGRTELTHLRVDETVPENVCEEENNLVFRVLDLRSGYVALYATSAHGREFVVTARVRRLT
jgi:hypothetical protein